MLCRQCREKAVSVRCEWCGKELCSDCLKMDLIASGCGSITAVYGCEDCLQDHFINSTAP